MKSPLSFLQLIDPNFTSRGRKQPRHQLRLAIFLELSSISVLVLTDRKAHDWNLSLFPRHSPLHPPRPGVTIQKANVQIITWKAMEVGDKARGLLIKAKDGSKSK